MSGSKRPSPAQSAEVRQTRKREPKPTSPSKPADIEAGKWGNLRGKLNEQKFIDAYEQAQANGFFPDWLFEVRKGTKEEDQNGIDAMALTNAGPIKIQIKSSENACKQFREQEGRRHIICFAMDDAESHRGLFLRTFPKIVEIHRRRIRRRKPDK